MIKMSCNFFQKVQYVSQKEMQPKNKTKSISQLPKIGSQKRIHTAFQRKNTQQDKVLSYRPLSNNNRTRSLRAFTTNSVRLDAQGQSYTKKMEEIQKQTFLVDRQIKQVEEQIKILRQTIGNSKKQPGVSRLNQSSSSYINKIANRKNIPQDQQTIKTELKNLQSKFINYRNKIDTHLQKNKNIQNQIDTYRKEILTLQNINSQLQISTKITSKKYQEQSQLSKKLDAEIALKTQLTHRKKIENMHQKTQMIKQYDVILKTLDKQLTQERKINQDGKSQFYLTDIVEAQKQYENILKNDSKHQRRIVSGKKPKITEIYEKLKIYEHQFEQLKQKIGSQNIEQITKKFTQEYQKNFHQYNFINQMYKQYEEINAEHFQLLQKKNQLLKQLKGQKSGSKAFQILEMKSKISRMNKKKQKIKQDMVRFNKLATQIRLYLSEYELTQSNDQKKTTNLLNQHSVTAKLHQVFEKYSKNIGFYSQKGQTKRISKNSILPGKQSINDLIQQVKEQSQSLKDNRLLTRQQLRNNTIQLKQKKMYSSVNNRKKQSKKIV